MKNNKCSKVLLSILFLGYTSIYAQEIETIQNKASLSDLINISLANNSNIEITRSKSQGKKAVIDFAKSSYLPNLNAASEIGQYGVNSGTTNSSKPLFGATITATQLLYDFGKTTSQIDTAKKDYIAAQKELISNIMDTILSVKKAYYNILNQHQLIDVANEAVDIDQLQYEQAQEYFKAGVRTKIDVTDAQLRLSNSNLDLINAQYDLKSAKTELIVLIGKNISESFHVNREKEEIENSVKKITYIKKEVNEFTQIALLNRAELSMYKALIGAQQEQIKNVNAEYFPTLDFGASYTNQETDLAVLDTEQWNASINLKWNFYTGNSTDASLKENLASLKSLKSQLKQQELVIIQQVTDAFLNVKRTQESIKIAQLNVTLSTQNLSLADQRYKSGLNDMVELNDAKLNYTKSKSNFVNTYYKYLTAVANLDYSIGIIHD